MTTLYKISVGIFLVVLFLTSSCKKYLETKSIQTLSTPSTLEDLQLLLDNPDLTNMVGLAYGGTDEYYVLYSDWASRSEGQQHAYIWHPQFDDLADWNIAYKNIFYANNILLNLETIDATGRGQEKDNIKGSALFIRAHAFYHLAQFYAPQYDPVTAPTDLGLPLRLSANFNESSIRATVQETYDQIIQDLTSALPLLSNNTVTIKIRPGKAACYALLARVYLQMGNYSKAKENADGCLQIYSSLIDYNTLLPVASFFPMPLLNNNIEILFYSRTDAPLNANYVRAKADSNLYKSYKNGDIRKDVFFSSNGNGTYAFRGNYTAESVVLFNGLATDEVYLIRAEANARLGNKDAALQDLNTLLVKRWLNNGSFVPVTAPNSDEALKIILQERKKELVNRGTRWPDLRRLNKEPAFAETLKRNLNNQLYELSPTDPRYTLLIPRTVINLTSLPQNSR